jgi:hypothetical protein
MLLYSCLITDHTTFQAYLVQTRALDMSPGMPIRENHVNLT